MSLNRFFGEAVGLGFSGRWGGRTWPGRGVADPKSELCQWAREGTKTTIAIFYCTQGKT